MKTIRITLPNDVVQEIDLLVRIGRYSSRSEIIIKALNEFLSREFMNVKNRTFTSSFH
ncbi:MAG: ribbon-helix-helix domain-containing protein [Candidatus Methanomethylicia archaeon]